MTGKKLPVLKPRELIAVLQKLGFINTRKSPGSHWRFVHPGGRKTTVPVHKGTTISKGLLRKILRDVDISPAQLRELLRKKR